MNGWLRRSAEPIARVVPITKINLQFLQTLEEGGYNESAISGGLSTLYQDLLGGSYDCVDRIVLNAFFPVEHDPGGFRVWWRALTGSDETLENAYLMRLAGRFSRRVRGYA